MPDSVSVDHGGVTVTTNTASEADLRAELEAPAPEAPHIERLKTDLARHAVIEADLAFRARDAQGRFAPKPDAPSAAPEPPAEADAPPSTGDKPASTGDKPARDPSLPRHNLDVRIAKAIAQKADAERRAATLEAELARYRQPAPPPAAPPAASNGHGEPQFEQFADAPDPYTAYLQAWTRWDRAQAIAQARAEWDAEQTTRTKTQQLQARLAEGRTHFPDFDQVLTEADTLGLQVSAVMQTAITESPHAADLVYFLATHPEECLQLAEESQQTPVAAAPVMRRLLESRLAPRAAASTGPGPAARASVSTAKPPVTPVGSSPVVSDEPPGDSASAAEHARYWNRRLKVPGTR